MQTVLVPWSDCTADPTAAGCVVPTPATSTFVQIDTDQFAVLEWGLALCVFLLAVMLVGSWARRG